MQSAPGEIAELMDRLRTGSKEAAGQLVALFYPELRRLARSHMRREAPGHSWQPTVLVNQLYLELIKIKALKKDERNDAKDDRRAFFGLAAHLMRRLLIHHSRPLAQQVEMTDLADDVLIGSGTDELAVIENLLNGLEQVDPEFRTVAELKVFEGLSMEEVAAQLDIPLRTAYRRWTFARTWLAKHL
ncbi:MAG TPA: ECF-type sigma factor [Bryobacteraceae bacterium]|nr:ECF-type sigma factor [Bryobacteraceae bacterium]